MIARKTLLFVIAGLTCTVGATACPTCTPRNSSGLDTVIHGASPQGPLDYLIAGAMVVGVLGTAVATVRAIVRREQAS